MLAGGRIVEGVVVVGFEDNEPLERTLPRVTNEEVVLIAVDTENEAIATVWLYNVVSESTVPESGRHTTAQ